MDWDDCFNPKSVPGPDPSLIEGALRGEKLLQFVGRQIEGLRIDIDKYRSRSQPGNTACSGEKRKGRRHDRVTRSDPQGRQNQKFRIGAG